jgi:hypothetical protein
MSSTTKFGDWSFLQTSLLLSDDFIRKADKVYITQTDIRTRLFIKKDRSCVWPTIERRLLSCLGLYTQSMPVCMKQLSSAERWQLILEFD